VSLLNSPWFVEIVTIRT